MLDDSSRRETTAEENVLKVWAADGSGAFDQVDVCFFGSSRGRGLVARSDFEVGAVALRDKPLAARQHDFSRLLMPCCERCFAPLDDFEAHLQRVLSNGKRTLRSFEGVARHPLLRHPRLSGSFPLPCPTVGCRAVFCSAACRDMELTAGAHRVLCVELAAGEDSVRRRRSWADFGAHARKHHENFLLAAVAIAQAMARVAHVGVPPWLAKAELLSLEHRPWHLLPESPRRLGGLSSLPTADLAAQRMGMVTESLSLLRSALRPASPPSAASSMDCLFEFDFYTNLLGEFDLVNVSIEYANPFEATLQHALSETTAELHPLATLLETSGLLQEISDITGCGGQVEGGDLLPPFLGVGLARAVALMNHSCTPSCEVDYHGNGIAVVTMLSPMLAGSELTISYIDEGMPLGPRQVALQAEYGFSCTCGRCQAESIAELARRGRERAADTVKAKSPLQDWTVRSRGQTRSRSRG